MARQGNLTIFSGACGLKPTHLNRGDEPMSNQPDSKNEKPVPCKKMVMPACNYECDTVKTECSATSKEGNLCCREDGHEGSHIACNDEHAVDIWEQA